MFSMEHIAWLALTGLVFLFVYRAVLHPLRNVPGPFKCRLSALWIHYHSYIGDDCSTIQRLHEVYGPVVRIGPNEVVVSDGGALAAIYCEKGGFLKASCYSNFDAGGHATIFSSLDPNYRAVRSKAMLPLFSMSSIRASEAVLEAVVEKFVSRLEDAAKQCRKSKARTGQSIPCNMLNLCRGLALDMVTSHLFGTSYGGLDERGDTMSATSFVEAAVAVGHFFFLSNWAFRALRVFAGEPEANVSDFVQAFINITKPDSSTFQSRLMKTNITKKEIKAQCEDVIFAGTDSTGMNLATICWHLAKQPEVYAKLRHEVAEADASSLDYSPQSLRYLDAVVREGLRVAMANPTRLPRVVPPTGFAFTATDGRSYIFPAGTVIGAQSYSLHFDPAVFHDPYLFKPERWLNDPSSEMQRNFMAFGQGQRGCIARNLATQELLLTFRAIARTDVLKGARTVGDKIEIMEWFSSKVKGGRIDIVWD